MIGWTVDKPDQARLRPMFGRGAIVRWLSPVKLAVLADEMLRQYFHAPNVSALVADVQTPAEMFAKTLHRPVGSATRSGVRIVGPGSRDRHGMLERKIPLAIKRFVSAAHHSVCWSVFVA